MNDRIGRRVLLAGGAALAPAAGRGVRAQSLDKVSFQTNWRAQAEHGGFYQAVASGLYRKHGIDAEIRMGGPQQNPAQLLLAGRVDMIMSNSLQALNYVKENLPFLSIGAIMQKDPQGLMTHPGVGHDSFEALKGKPVMVGAGGRVSFWPWLRARFGYTDEQLRPYTFNIAPFLADRNAAMQCFVSSEPLLARDAGVQPLVHLFADRGFENYQTTIDVSRRTATERKDVVQRFVNATLEGWSEYLGQGDVAAAHALIKRDNPDMTDAKLVFARQTMIERGIVKSGDADSLGIGAMTAERWRRFYETMRDAGVYPAGMDVSRAFTLDFVNKRVGLG